MIKEKEEDVQTLSMFKICVNSLQLIATEHLCANKDNTKLYMLASLPIDHNSFRNILITPNDLYQDDALH